MEAISRYSKARTATLIPSLRLLGSEICTGVPLNMVRGQVAPGRKILKPERLIATRELLRELGSDQRVLIGGSSPSKNNRTLEQELLDNDVGSEPIINADFLEEPRWVSQKSREKLRHYLSQTY